VLNNRPELLVQLYQVLGHPNLVPTMEFAAPMSALIHLSKHWSIFGISTLRYSRGPPTYSHFQNDARTLHCSSHAGDRGSVGRAMDKTRGVITSQVTFPRLISQTGVRSRARLSPRPKLDRRAQCPVLYLSISKNQSVHVFVVFIHLVYPPHLILHN
jgi:hypothetical protein